MIAELIGAIGLVSAALVSSVFGYLAKKFRKENEIQHLSTSLQLKGISEDVKELRDSIGSVRSAQQRHLEWHSTQQGRD